MQYFFPSEARTADGKFIPADALMMDEYCMKCHQDIYNDHLHSAHKFSSFNNPAYLFSVTRDAQGRRWSATATMKPSRWCAGCHDPVPFFSGAFDDPNFDDREPPDRPRRHHLHRLPRDHARQQPDRQRARTPSRSRSTTRSRSATNPALQWVNNQLVKAKPEFHKKTFLKPFHKTAEFCSTCHKVRLPVELNHYKEFLRGQNHYDTFLLSGVSGHGVAELLLPADRRRTNCADVPHAAEAEQRLRREGLRRHRRAQASTTTSSPAANTGLFELLKHDAALQGQHAAGFQTSDRHARRLPTGTDPDGSDKKLRIDLFGLKPGGSDSTPSGSIAPLRPELPKLKPGKTYVVEVVVRTLNIGHPFTQGTADSNEIWVDFQATARRQGDRPQRGAGEPGRHRPGRSVVALRQRLMLDRNGNRINRRNPQDIFTPLYDKQIPPGAAAGRPLPARRARRT